MTSYEDWLEETIGFREELSVDQHVEANDISSYEGLPDARLRDAVLCLVDCRREMFASPMQPYESIVSSGQACERKFKDEESNVSTSLTSSGKPLDVKNQDTNSMPVHLTAFGQALEGVRCLYRNKPFLNDKDPLALVLYNTAVEKNAYECRGVYIFHSFEQLGLSSLHELEELAASAVDPGSSAYMKFVQEIGHLPADQPPALSEALDAAYRMFLNPSMSTVKNKRIFVFTNDDDPTCGNEQEHDKCIAHSRRLANMGVIIEVFGVGKQIVERGPPASAAAPAVAVSAEIRQAVATPSGAPAVTSSMTIESSAGVHSVAPKGTGDFVENIDDVAFPVSAFWKRLLYEVSERMPYSGSLRTGELTFRNGSCHIDCHARAVGIGGTLGSSFDGFLESVRRKIRPQRPYLNCGLFIGVNMGGGDVPHMAVSLYCPLLPATGQSIKWMERTTNAPVNRRIVLLKKTDSSLNGSAGRDRKPYSSGTEDQFEEDVVRDKDCTDRQDIVLGPDEVCDSTQIGGTTIVFSRMERVKLAEMAAAGVVHGITIVCFKRYEDVIKHKHIINHSTFVHANLSEGGHNSLRLFVQLVRTLRTQGKVGIAQYAMKHIPPRLVALVPSPDFATARQHDIPETSLPTQGLGFYMVRLPYAEDIYPVPDLAMLPSRIKGLSPKVSPDAVSEKDIQRAKEVIDALSVRYDILAVPNPSLQLQRHVLEDLILRQPVFPRAGQAEGEPSSEASRSVTPPARCERPETGRAAMSLPRDWTLPDKVVMARYAELFQDFNAFVLGESYDPEWLCAQQRTTAGSPRRPRACRDNTGDTMNVTKGGNLAPISHSRVQSKYDNDIQNEERGSSCMSQNIKELVRDAADRNAWHRLTIVQLKEYLKAVGHPIGHDRKKDALIGIVKDAYFKEEG